MQLSENHEIIRDIARRFTEEQIVPIAAELDAEARYPEKTMQALGEMGFLGVNVPEEYGGAGLDTVSYAIRGEGRVATQLLRHRPSELCISSITLAELQFGAEAKRSRKLRNAIASFVKSL